MLIVEARLDGGKLSQDEVPSNILFTLPFSDEKDTRLSMKEMKANVSSTWKLSGFVLDIFGLEILASITNIIFIEVL